MTPEQYEQTPLGETLAELNREIAVAAQDGFSVILDLEDARRLARAAALLMEIHSAADQGELDGVDLAWIVNSDECILGKEESE